MAARAVVVLPNAHKTAAHNLHDYGGDGLGRIGHVFVRSTTKDVKGVSVMIIRSLVAIAILGGMAAVLQNPSVSAPTPVASVPKADPVATTQAYDCHYVLIDIASARQVWGRAVDEMQHEHARQVEHPLEPVNNDWAYKLDYTEKLIIAKGEEYLAHPECTEEADKVREIVKDTHDLQATK
jgi:hypothetical protein